MGGDAPECNGRSPGTEKCQGIQILRNDPRNDIFVVSSLRAESVSLRRSMKLISSQRRRRLQLAGRASLAGWASEVPCSSGIRSLISGEAQKRCDNLHLIH